MSALSNVIIRGGVRRAINVLKDRCAATLTTRYGAISYANIFSKAHYPMSAVLYEYE